MKLADRTVEIHSSGIKSANQFSIAQSSKMFRILSDSLYSDKIQAVIRELSTNAYDSHIAAGNKNPFRVTLPTQANPVFCVRDFGTGLSQQDMEELYTTYGASNKNDSNDFVGCLGLGSKSPFAYTKSFSTVSYHNGKKLSYIAAMDEEGVPSLNLVSITETDEPNGLEISFAVKQYDFHEFTSKAKRIFHYFKMRPIVEGGICGSVNDHSYSHTNVVIEGQGWKIGRVSTDHTKYPSQHNSPGSGVIAIMGNIAYPVDSTKIVGEDKPDQPNHIQAWNRAFGKSDVDNWKNLVKEILSSGLYLEIQFSIGELEMDVSREGLQYTKQVVNALRDKTQEIYLQLKQDMTEKLKEAKSLVDAYTTYYSLSELAGGWTAGASWTDLNGTVHELTSGKDLEYKLKKNKLLYVINYRSSGYRSRRLVYLTNMIHSDTMSGRGAYSYYGNYARKSGKIAFFRCDVKGEETAKKIVTRYCNLHDCYAYLMIDSDNPQDSTEGFDQLIKDIGGDANVLKVSDYRSLLTNGTRKSRGSTGTISKDEIFVLDKLGVDSDCKELGGNDINDSHLLNELSDSLVEYVENEDNEIVYIPIVRYASIKGYPSISRIIGLSDNENTVLGKKLFDSQKIFAIKQSSVEKLKKQGINLVSFNDWFAKYAKKLFQKLSDQVSAYQDVIEYAKREYETEESASQNRYYYHATSDKQIAYHIFNLFGLEYRKYINNTQLCDLIDQWLLIEFFAVTINSGRFDISRFKKEDYFATMATILAKYGINGIDPTQIRTNYIDMRNMKSIIDSLYSGEEGPISLEAKDSKNQSSKIIAGLPTIASIRKNLKEQVDKAPILKYIVGSQSNDGNIRRLSSNNPTKVYDESYRNKAEWFMNMSGEQGIEQFRVQLGGLI